MVQQAKRVELVKLEQPAQLVQKVLLPRARRVELAQRDHKAIQDIKVIQAKMDLLVKTIRHQDRQDRQDLPVSRDQ